MKNNTMIPYNPKKDLETNYYNKTEVELLVAGGSGGSIDLSNYYKKLETYSKAQVDALVAGGGADLSDYYTKAEVESLISAIPTTDLTNYYNKTQVDSLIPNISTKQDTLVSATNIKTINGESVLGSGNIVISSGGAVDLSEYYKKTEVDAIALDKVDKVAGKQLSTEDYTTAEKTKLSGLSNYVKPASEPISYIDGLQSALGDKVDKVSKQALHSTDALRVTGTIVSLYKGDGTFDSITTQDTIYTHPNSGVTAGTYSKVTVNAQGHITAGASLSASDIPSLDASKITSGTIDSARLPSFVDDVLEFVNLAGFPATGEAGKIYIALDTNKTYRWSGSTYVFITSGAVDSVAGKTGVVSLAKGDVGLDNVDNTKDIDKPISTATQTALNSKVDKVAGKGLSTEDYTTAEKTKLTGLSNYTKPASEPISYITGLQTALDSKVSKTGVETLHSTDALRISGTTLSLYKGDGTFESVVTQDTVYTLPTATSTVKGGIEIFSDTVQTITANAVSTTSGRTYGIQLNSNGQAVVNVPWSDTNMVYTLPTASATVLGGIKVGTNLSIDANGVLSANDTNVSFTEISNKPTNLSGYGITDAYTKTQVDTMVGDIASALNTINGQVI